MGREIRWLVEAKTPLEEVTDEENKANSNMDKAFIKYKKANNIQQKDDAVADALNTIVGNNAGEKLRRSLGIGMLSRFMDAFKWDSLTLDNLFIRLLQRVFGNYSDSKLVQQILSGQHPTASRDMNAKVNQSQVNQNTQSTQDVETSVDPGMIPTTVESLNEAGNRSRERWKSKALSNKSVRSVKNSSSTNRPTLSVKAKAAQDAETTDNTQVQQKVNREETQADNSMSNDDAKILDMSSRDLFTVLYNGYLNHLYTYEDIINIDNDTTDNSTITGKDGKKYVIAKSLRDIINRCQNDENAFTYKGQAEKQSTTKQQSNNNTKDAKDLPDKIIKAAKDLSWRERDMVIREISKIR